MTYTCLDQTNPSRLRGLKHAADVLSNVRLGTAPGEIFTVPQQAGWTKSMAVFTLYFDVDGRTKRAFIVKPYNPVSHPERLIVGWPGSDGTPGSNGAMVCINPYDGYGNVNTWFSNLVMDQDCIGLAIDLPAFGSNPYPGNYAPDPHKPMLDDLCALLAYQYAAENFNATTGPMQPATNIFMGGWSYGAIRAEHCAALAPSVLPGVSFDGMYIASGQIDKRIDTRPEFNPGEWAYDGGFNYANLAAGYVMPKVRYSFGGPKDYAYVTNPVLYPTINAILSGIVSINPSKFSRYDHNQGHVPVWSDIRDFCRSIWQ